VITTQQWRDHFIRWEGRCSHFYLDSNNVVTIGIGCQVTEPSMLSLLRKSDNQPATRADIFSDWNAVKTQPPNRPAEYYGVFCGCYLPETETYRLFEKRLADGVAQINAEAISLATLPDEAQLVVVDMAFNLGTHGLLAFHNFLNALKQNPPDFHRASLECHRLPPVPKERNDWARETLEALDRTAA
jgi:GH24 family phage-related lysozyme (muramidase)